MDVDSLSKGKKGDKGKYGPGKAKAKGVNGVDPIHLHLPLIKEKEILAEKRKRSAV